ncbi:MAG: response regulator [Phycisphaerales bacterium]|nr:MAG: response regulator [Phycisphaerales bacterium]
MTTSGVNQLHVLMLGEPDCGEEFIRWIDSHAQVEHVHTFEAALQALRAEPFDLIISQAADFIPFHGVHISGQAAAILDGVSQGVGIVDESGNLEWANPKLLSFSEEIRKHVCDCCVKTFKWARKEAKAGLSHIRGRRFSFMTENNRCFEATATPVIDLHNRITEVAAVVWDATNAKRLQDRIDAIDRAGRELLSLDVQQFSRLDTHERLALLEQKILRCTRELLHFDNFEIRILDKKTNKLELVLMSGMPEDAHEVEVFAVAEGNGICGYVAARGRSYICPDVKNDPRYRPGIADAHSSLTVPLILHEQVVGVANFENTKLAAFNENDRQFAEIFARYITLAFNILDMLVTERHTTTGRLGSDVMAEITEPLNDILTDVENLVEDYIGHDDLRHRLRQMSENVVRIRETIKEITSRKPALIGSKSSKTKRTDPELEGKRILVADDEDIIRETVCDVLSGYGCLVSSAADGAVALELVAAQPFDLVLSDIKMPGSDGYQVFAAAKDANPDTPVILTTGFGYDPNHAIVRARREGLASVLFKPFKVDQLLSEIRMALASKEK